MARIKLIDKQEFPISPRRTRLQTLLCFCVPLGFAPLLLPSISIADVTEADTRRLASMPASADALGMGGATTSNVLGLGSDNPATIATLTEYRYLNLTASTVNYSKSANVRASEFGVTLPLLGGVLDVALGNTKAKRSASSSGEEYSIARDPYVAISYARQIATSLIREDDEFFAGAVLYPRYRTTEYRFYSEHADTLVSKSKFNGGGIGFLYASGRGLSVGASYSRFRSASTERFESQEQPPSRSTSQSSSLKVGVSQQVFAGTTVSLEYQRYESGKALKKLFGGTESCFQDRWCAYLGYNGSGVTTGIGYRNEERLFVSLAYGSKIANGISSEFGESPVLSGSISVVW